MQTEYIQWKSITYPWLTNGFSKFSENYIADGFGRDRINVSDQIWVLFLYENMDKLLESIFQSSSFQIAVYHRKLIICYVQYLDFIFPKI